MGTARIPKPVFTNETPDCDCSSEVSGASDLTFASDRESDDPPTADLISFSDDEEYDDQIFTSTLEGYNRTCFAENIDKFKFWVFQTMRKLIMLNAIAEEQNYGQWMDELRRNQFERRLKKVHDLNEDLEFHNSRGKLHFSLLFELSNFLEYCPPSFLLKQSLIRALNTLLTSWIETPVFHVKNYEKLKCFLRSYFEDPTSNFPANRELRGTVQKAQNLSEIITVWKNSNFYTPATLDKILNTRDVIKSVYLETLTDKVDELIKIAASPLGSVVELGYRNVTFFQEFLKKFSVPVVGPFKNSDISAPRFVYFVSSINRADPIANSGVPLFGCYEFKLSSMRDFSVEQSLNLWKTLDTVPAWIQHSPPIFNLSLEKIRDQILCAQKICT